jgi:V/A-type H+/Na+-transporting ATPase subunit I
MRFRPQKSLRFTLYTPRSETVRALETLARSGEVELDAQPVANATLDIRRLQPLVTRYEQLLHECGARLPDYQACPLAPRGALDVIATDALAQLTDWCARMQVVAERRDALRVERENLQLLVELLAHTHASQHDLARFGTHSELLYKGLFACPIAQAPQVDLRNTLEEVVQGPAHRFYLYLGLPEQRPSIEEALTPVCAPLGFPDWLQNAPGDWRTLVRQRLVALDMQIAQLDAESQTLRDEPGLFEALGEMSLLRWYLRLARTLSQDERFCYVTGWTTAPDELRAVLKRAGIKSIVRFPPDIRAGTGPVALRSSGWLAPFEVFLSLYGTPNENEIDPRPLLAIIVPLLFGYMFPDVGHGLVLAALGAALYNRWPTGRFLVPCGLAAAAFGVVFGEVFGFEEWITPLWIHPLDDPLLILIVPMVFGIGLILLGIVLAGVESHWRGAGWRWWQADAAILPLYLGVLALPWWPAAWPIPVAALTWFLLGAVLRDHRTPVAALLAALAQLLESSFQLLTNTLSFARVGAFALAHAGLSKALLYLGAGIDNPILYVVYLLLSQAVMLTLEALIVFVQTVRLVFLEFFLRFLRAEGRVLVPLRPPQS